MRLSFCLSEAVPNVEPDLASAGMHFRKAGIRVNLTVRSIRYGVTSLVGSLEYSAGNRRLMVQKRVSVRIAVKREC